ncbi:hypothetical protein DFH28DRAFT_972315 [Melampsora americana]|nr:hypothetical protein DFH28DRAFT_972315 [Melampsora americana]
MKSDSFPICVLDSYREHDLVVLQQPGCGCVASNQLYPPPTYQGRIPIGPAIILCLRGNEIAPTGGYRLQCIIKLLDNTGQRELPNMLVGYTFAHCFDGTDLDGQRRCFFIFGDTAVKEVGVFRLRVELQRVWPDSPEPELLTSVVTSPFPVVRNWEFPVPGVELRTLLSDHLRSQGAHIVVPPSLNQDGVMETANGYGGETDSDE